MPFARSCLFVLNKEELPQNVTLFRCFKRTAVSPPRTCLPDVTTLSNFLFRSSHDVMGLSTNSVSRATFRHILLCIRWLINGCLRHKYEKHSHTHLMRLICLLLALTSTSSSPTRTPHTSTSSSRQHDKSSVTAPLRNSQIYCSIFISRIMSCLHSRVER